MRYIILAILLLLPILSTGCSSVRKQLLPDILTESSSQTVVNSKLGVEHSRKAPIEVIKTDPEATRVWEY